MTMTARQLIDELSKLSEAEKNLPVEIRIASGFSRLEEVSVYENSIILEPNF